MTTVFAVVGQHHDDPDRLLLLGTDGQYYQYVLPDETTTPVVPDESWVMDPNPPPIDEVMGFSS
ncbi:MAG TPA: hypothetical protein VH482_16560 [Thermomicrobiales bacterium]|jgi:hypothetical protein